MATEGAEILDFSDSIGAFVILSRKGQLFALNGIAVGKDFSKLVPRINTANFHAVYPLVARAKPSNIVMVIHPSEHAQAYFLMDIKTGPMKKTIKVFQETVDIITNALEDDCFPIIHLGELQKAALQSRKNQTPLSVPIRHLELRPTLPVTWSAAVKDLFLQTAGAVGDKTKVLEEKLQVLRDEVRESMLENFLVKFIWMDAESGYLGRLRMQGTRSKFTAFGPGDAQTTSFLQSLAKGADDNYETLQEFANVIPTLMKQHPWTSPTLHIYDDDFRTKNRFDEFYSLYKGLKVRCGIGAPVLLHTGEDFGSVIPVALLRPYGGGGDVTQISVREFPAKEVVWAETTF